MYLLYLKWTDGYREILALCSTKEKADEFKNQAIKENAILDDYINIIEIEQDKLYAWHELTKVI